MAQALLSFEGLMLQILQQTFASRMRALKGRAGNQNTEGYNSITYQNRENSNRLLPQTSLKDLEN